ncbi:M4 family metallopeptidase [Hamadaea tsunoensis]|uniref:M4 family metallopeptidase n=1 Tax=Hamadaea tsunoensis TaxID=53368 RepID=UPI00041D371F|nr:M4 family metallopeptidase [Hamadaea tsunoensis]
MKATKGVRALGAFATLAICAAVGISPIPAAAGPDKPVAGATTPRQRAARSAAALVSGRPSYLHASAKDAFVQGEVMSSGTAQYVPYNRTYGGLRVVGGDFVVVTDSAGRIMFNSVAQSRAIGDLGVTPALSAAAAEQVARAQLRTVSRVEGSTLIVYALGATPALAYESIVDGTSADGVSRLSVYVDARTGAVLGTQEHVAAGTGTAAYNGPNPLTIATTHSGSTYALRDPVTTNLSCQDAATNTILTGPDDVWGNGVATSRETACVDALYAAQTEVKMLSQWLGRNGMDGSGGAWPIRIGLNDENAYYDGSQIQIGHNAAGAWIGSLDVVGHELGHGVDDHTPGGISGGNTQEFVADTFGASTEWFANEAAAYDPPDFSVGEEINLTGSGPVRYMYKPSLAGGLDCYSSAVSSAEVHAAAGPGDHWFYLLAEGSSPTNGQPASPTCNSTAITGLGMPTAMKIMYNAMLMKTTAASYLKYRTWTLQAAKNLFPNSCAEFNVVKAAWNAVSVPAQTADPTCTGLALANPGTQTGTVGTATSLALSAAGGATPYTFSATGLPAGLTVNAASGVVSGTPTTAATYSVTAKVTDNASPTHATSSQTFSWTIAKAGTCSSPGQKIVNGGFESGSAPWTASAGIIGSAAGETAHSGTKYAWLGGYGTAHTDTLAQSVTLPAGCTTYTLTYWLHVDSAEASSTAQFDKLTLTGGSAVLATYSNLNKATGYALYTVNVSAFAGKTVVLTFTGVEDASLQTSFVVDDVALNVA